MIPPNDMPADTEPKKGWRPTPEYNSWTNMKQRCLNPNHPAYSYYGGRGITVCREWIDSFAAFYEHVGDKPTPAHTIDRIDNEGNYEPGNVRWATKREQVLNQRRQMNVSGIKGVRKHKYGYQVYVNIDGSDVYIGFSTDKHIASEMYQSALRTYEATKKHYEQCDAAIRIDELEKWLPVADTWAKQEGIYGPQIQFKRRIAELSTPTDQKEKE